MSAQAFQIISIVGFSLAALFAVLAIIIFFVVDIPAVLGELSGKTAEKQVEILRAQNRKEASRRHVAELDYRATGNTGKTSVTEKIAPRPIVEKSAINEKKLVVEETTLLNSGVGTPKNDETTLLNETTMLDGTTMLDETTLLNETTLLSEPEVYDETTLLSAPVGDVVEILHEEIEVHSKNRI